MITLIPGVNPVPLYTELALDPVTWDLMMPIQYITGAPALVQRIKVRFRFFLGEWFLDLRQGVPYIQQILVKDPNLNAINAIFTKLLTTTPGVETVQSPFFGTLDKPTRVLSGSFGAKLASGAGTLVVQSEPFIL